jgi:hypothetical protein
MIPEIRKKYNAEFSEETYEAFLRELNSSEKYPTDFRSCETPLFLSQDVTQKLITASSEIVSRVFSNEYREQSRNAIPKKLYVPNESEHPTFLQIDFAVAHNENKEFIPQLIELQGFPSLYCFQVLLDNVTRHHFYVPQNFETYFNGYTSASYIQFLREIIVGNSSPENVILLEIEPEKQKTRIDFACTESMLGIPPVCITNIIKRGKKLFYKKNEKEIPVERIYNRVIFDELHRKNLPVNFHFTDELDVEWIGHPNWFFRISKYSLPFIKSNFAPPAFFLNELAAYPEDLHNYVLKPLYSFAGTGVEIDVTADVLNAISEQQNFILQKKIDYAPLVETPDGFAKAEVRMMFVWKEKPLLVNNLVRMSKGKMMGVNFNKNKTWVGSGLAYHPKM